jgi:hypothetical protein
VLKKDSKQLTGIVSVESDAVLSEGGDQFGLDGPVDSIVYALINLCSEMSKVNYSALPQYRTAPLARPIPLLAQCGPARLLPN